MVSGLRPISTTVVMPCLNDWVSLDCVLDELDSSASHWGSTNVIMVDDGSTSPIPVNMFQRRYENLRLSLVRLQCNLGHQRALCIGLVLAAQSPAQAIVLMDSDGEDRPQDVARLLEELQARNVDAVVAERGKRHSGNTFIALYRIFRLVFRLLTGRSLNYGNFMVLTPATASRLAHTPDSWNNIPTSLMRSRVSIAQLSVDRGERHAGKSRLGLVGLINHGLGAISVFADVVFTRLIVASSAALGLSALVGLAAVVTRIATGNPLPGWFALMTTAVALGSLVLLVTVALLTFTMLATKGNPALPPTAIAGAYVDSHAEWSEAAQARDPHSSSSDD